MANYLKKMTIFVLFSLTAITAAAQAGQEYGNVEDLFKYSPYTIGGKIYKLKNTTVVQLISRRKALMSSIYGYYVGRFPKYAPQAGNVLVYGICDGVGAMKYYTTDGALKIVPEVSFFKYKIQTEAEAIQSLGSNPFSRNKASQQALKSLANLSPNAADRAFDQR